MTMRSNYLYLQQEKDWKEARWFCLDLLQAFEFLFSIIYFTCNLAFLYAMPHVINERLKIILVP